MKDQKLNYKVNKNCGTIRNASTPQFSNKSCLIVVLHGILNSHNKTNQLVEAIEEFCPQADTWVPLLPYRFLWSTIKMDTMIKKLREDLDLLWSQGTYDSLKIIGHSMGGVCGRSLILEGRNMLNHLRGTNQCGRRRYWADTNEKDRIILLAAVNRGSGISRHMGPWRVVKIALSLVLGNILQLLFLQFTLFSMRRGSKYITNMRLEWIEAGYKDPLPLTIQLLGSIDDIVGPNDSIDLATGENFRYLDIEKTGHLNILNMGDKNSGKEFSPDENIRRETIKKSLLYSSAELKKEEIRPWDLEEIDDNERRRRTKVKNVVFIIHGIRDVGHWTDKIARRVWLQAGRPRDGSLEKIVDSYGYLGMGPFLIPSIRWRKVAWLMERYLEVRAKYPNAKCSYIGHSHGTYVLAKALETYKLVKFHNIVFAGSIVRENYPWVKYIKEKKVSRVLNFVATNDLVVAWFPRLFDLYNLQDLGGAGHNGFIRSCENGPIYTIEYASGAHGAGKREDLWNAIASFVLRKNSWDAKEKPPEIPAELINKHRLRKPWPMFVWLLSWGNILVWASLAMTLFFIVPIAILKLIGYISEWYNYDQAKFKEILVIVFSTIGLWGAILVSVAYVRLAWIQKSLHRSKWWIRNFILFPAVLIMCIIGINALIGLVFSNIYLDVDYLFEVKSWSSAALVLWALLVITVLRKI